MRRVDLESHAQLRGHVPARVAVVGKGPATWLAVKDAAAFPGLRLVQSLFQTTEISPPGCTTPGATSWRSARLRIAARSQEAHSPTPAKCARRVNQKTEKRLVRFVLLARPIVDS